MDKLTELQNEISGIQSAIAFLTEARHFDAASYLVKVVEIKLKLFEKLALSKQPMKAA